MEVSSLSLSLLSFHLTLKEFPIFCFVQDFQLRIMGLSINNSLYCCLFFFLTGFHFFHLLLGLLLVSLGLLTTSPSSLFSLGFKNLLSFASHKSWLLTNGSHIKTSHDISLDSQISAFSFGFSFLVSFISFPKICILRELNSEFLLS